MSADAAAGSPVATSTRPATSPGSIWTRAMEVRVGIIPLPVYLLLLALVVAFAVRGKISGEVTVMIAVLVVGGFTCAEIGRRIPWLRAVGATR